MEDDFQVRAHKLNEITCSLAKQLGIKNLRVNDYSCGDKALLDGSINIECFNRGTDIRWYRRTCCACIKVNRSVLRRKNQICD